MPGNGNNMNHPNTPNTSTRAAMAMALFAALLFGLNAPLAKWLLPNVTPLFMVAFLYLGAGIGMLLLHALPGKDKTEAPLSRQDLPWILTMILLDVFAPFLLMLGLTLTTAANASLLCNFEMVATAGLALVFFHEAVGKRLWLSLGIITLASIFLCMDFADATTWRMSPGSLLVLAACTCWGLENNCTRNLSAKSPVEIVVVKGLGSGTTALAIALLSTTPFPKSVLTIVTTALLGFVAYGLSIFFYVKAQRHLGAARTSAYYAAAPFMGVLLSLLILKDIPSWTFAAAAVVMLYGVWLAIRENHVHHHVHQHLTHDHAHAHDDQHHSHTHATPMPAWHCHVHTHVTFAHEHQHTPDIHHRHQH